jgi:hypothetical protein
MIVPTQLPRPSGFRNVVTPSSKARGRQRRRHAVVVYVTYRVPVEVELETETGEIIDVHIMDEKLEGPRCGGGRGARSRRGCRTRLPGAARHVDPARSWWRRADPGGRALGSCVCDVRPGSVGRAVTGVHADARPAAMPSIGSDRKRIERQSGRCERPGCRPCRRSRCRAGPPCRPWCG